VPAVIAPIVTKLLKKCFSQEIFPDDFKTGQNHTYPKCCKSLKF